MNELREVLRNVAEELKRNCDEEQQKLAELSPSFENSEEALAYAKRLMALKPGDVALVPYTEQETCREGVYIGTIQKGNEIIPEFFVYDHDAKRLAITVTSWMSVTLKD